uniref:Ras homolog, mTORC1 binding n=1 Tax=Eptatretus burgeri TaxID=7764 RepID=A0A8C4N8D0_EPTBU
MLCYHVVIIFVISSVIRMPYGVCLMVRVVGLGSNNPELKSHLVVQLIPGGVDSACHPSEVGKMSASMLVYCGDPSRIVSNSQGDCFGSTKALHRVWSQWMDGECLAVEGPFTKTLNVNGQEFHLKLVDTAGQDEYSMFPQSYSMDIHGYILVYSVTSNKSFEVVQVIHEKLLDMVGNVQVPIVLVGNKKDLPMERVISHEKGKCLASSWNAAFMESTAKEHQTVVEVFKRMILEIDRADGSMPKEKSSCKLM